MQSWLLTRFGLKNITYWITIKLVFITNFLVTFGYYNNQPNF